VTKDWGAGIWDILHNFSCGCRLWDDFSHMVLLLGQFQRGFQLKFDSRSDFNSFNCHKSMSHQLFIKHCCIFSFVYFGPSLSSRNLVYWCHKNNTQFRKYFLACQNNFHRTCPSSLSLSLERCMSAVSLSWQRFR
jgi:hypothetical protein